MLEREGTNNRIYLQCFTASGGTETKHLHYKWLFLGSLAASP